MIIQKMKPAVLIALTAMLLLSAPFAHAAESEIKQGTITVNASGAAEIAPDMAIMSLSVVKIKKTARQALEANSKAMAAVIAALKAEGIAERDLQTNSFYIHEEVIYPKKSRVYDSNDNTPKIIGYRVHNGLTVRVRNLENVGKLLDRSVALGINKNGNIHFTNSKPEEAQKKARLAAMQNAIEKAKTLTNAAGVSLGRVLQISEQSHNRPFALRERGAAKQFDATPVPIQAGSNSYSVSVTVKWALSQ